MFSVFVAWRWGP